MPAGTILIADDDSAIRTVLNQALGRAGYDVRTTGTAAGLWRWISAGEGSLVITDVVLPDESGFDLIPRIKRMRPDLPILVMSAQNTLLTAITAAERGAFEYLPKPFDLKELTSVVGRALASPQGKRDAGAEPAEDRLPLIGRSPIRTDVRIIAATNRDLRQLISQGLFREDLYYRLNVVPLRLPPLRERVEDIPDLVRHFLRKAEDEGLPHKTVDNEALDLLRRHRWPGNVRELENLIRRLAVLQSGDTITAAAVSIELKEPAKTFAADSGEGPQSLAASVEQYLTQYFLAQGDRLPPPGVYDRIVQEVDRPLISLCLAATRGNQIRAAQLLGLNRNTLRKKIRDLGLEVIRGLRTE